MTDIPTEDDPSLAPLHDAPQHRPRPLPLFLEMLQEQTADSPERRTAALAGLRIYQQAARKPPAPPLPVLARAGRAVLRDGGGAGLPVVLVPSLINPPGILDLMPHRSLTRYLAARGLRPLLIDWGTPDARDRDIDAAGHVEKLLLPLIDSVGERVALAGYCLGGTLALAAAALRPVARLALIAAPWRFDGFPDSARGDLEALWRRIADAAETLGMVPMEVLQSAFWQLDPARTVAKYIRLAEMGEETPELAAFVTLEDWANDGAPLTCAVARDLLEAFFGANLTGSAAWQVGDRAIVPGALSCPVLDIVSTSDRIVPATSAAGIGDRMTLAQGHVGMMVGGKARELLWEPLADWLLQDA